MTTKSWSFGLQTARSGAVGAYHLAAGLAEPLGDSALRRYKNRIIDGRTLKVDKDAGLKQVLFKIEKLEG